MLRKPRKTLFNTPKRLQTPLKAHKAHCQTPFYSSGHGTAKYACSSQGVGGSIVFMALYKLCLGFVLYTLQRIHTMEEVATYRGITRNILIFPMFHFFSETTEGTTEYFILVRDSLKLNKRTHRRMHIDQGDGLRLQQIYNMEKDGDDFKLTYGNTSSHIYSNNHVVGTVILQMPEDETQRNRPEEYFNQFCDFFGSNSNQHVTRAGGLAPIRF